MKNLFLTIELILIVILVSLNSQTVNVYADWKEAESRKASTASVEYTAVNTDTSQEVKVTVCIPSTYVVSIPKETKDTFTVKVSGDIASDERLHLVVENINRYFYYNDLPAVITGRKQTKEKTTYKISLERFE